MAYEGVIRWLGLQGATSIARLTRHGRGRHPRLRFHWRGRDYFVTISGSPSSHWKAERDAITELKHAMGLIRGDKRIGERRAKRRRQKFEPKAINDPAAQHFRQFAPRGAIATLRDVWPEARA
jgi:hypothetical protein